MDTALLVILVVLVVVALLAAAAVYVMQQKKRSGQLQERFGPEYERTVTEEGRGKGEKELEQRADRVDKLDLRELKPDERQRFAEQWRSVQADFVDEPATAILEADELVQKVMLARGYPVADFEQRVADLSVGHAELVSNYRAAHEVSESHRQSPRSTEDLRQAMIHYRALFADLLGEVPSRSQATA